MKRYGSGLRAKLTGGDSMDTGGLRRWFSILYTTGPTNDPTTCSADGTDSLGLPEERATNETI